jgi:hypothetical protein
LPFDFDIFVPPIVTQPWWKDAVERLAEPDQAHLLHHLHEEARVERWPVAWSIPPM